MDDIELRHQVFSTTGPLVTREQARALGLAPRAVDRLVRTGAWVAVRRGVYAERAYVESCAHRTDLQRLADDAACLRIARSHVRSHESAAVVLGMQVLLPDPPLTHVTRPDVRGSRHEHGVKHHLAPYRPEQVLTVDGVRVLDHPRTALDIAREHGVVRGIVAADSALRAGVCRECLWAAFADMRCWPHSTAVRAAIERSDPGSDSVGESLARILVERLGRGRPQTQFGLRRDGRTAFVDLRIGRQLVELDGRLTYLPPSRGGVASRSPDQVLWEEKRRQDWLCGFKLGMSRLTFDDVWGPGQAAALARLEREVADTEARFGTDISDLAPYVVRRLPRPVSCQLSCAPATRTPRRRR
ncbi:type IV toxin-antitoxin system AbiEi family antitoxin domain-containing protein [Nocardioides dongkuii]|uniref:type IV toxin-antitoxin system AbiEi family antitoxin domain-containing protein n=1 Tax=Nocardioides dongkuii TaxID=2760089 RepID=UPI0015FC0526|nr:type IV toxin-antitoxin system AbiEi family antitoxin domain-containing protein [Nocardioides dongkuii]